MTDEQNNQDDDLIIDIVDDTPDEDKGRTPIPKEEIDKALKDEDLEDALDEHGKKTESRYKKLSKGYHDERRRAETAQRERDEAVRVAQQIVEENKRLRGQVNQGTNIVVEQAKTSAEFELATATKNFEDALEAGDTKKAAKAQQDLTNAQIRLNQAKNFRHTPLQENENDVQIQQRLQNVTSQDPKAVDWASKNAEWFQKDQDMTDYAFLVHNKLQRKGVAIGSDEYYEAIDDEMRKSFSDYFGESKPNPANTRAKKPAANTAPATRSTSPRKVTLTTSMVSIAKRLGITNEQYARELVKQQEQERA
jgi:hypothetical protein